MKLRAFVFSLTALAATASTVGETAAGAVTKPCTTAGLVVWLDTSGNAAAGSRYYTLKFTNQSGHTCALTGYPGVSALDLNGHALGSPASRNPSASKSVRLPDGATASAVLRIVEAVNFPSSSCRIAAAAGLRVYPPNETVSKVVPFPFQACSRTGPAVISVQAVTG